MHEQDEPMATYLATVQIGRYADWQPPGTPDTGCRSGSSPRPTSTPARSAPRSAASTRWSTCSRGCSAPTRSPAYTVVVTADDLEIPLESQSLSTFGRNLVRGDWDATRLIAHELAHQWFGNAVTAGPLARHLAARGLRLLRRVAVVGGVGRRAGRRARPRALGPALRPRPGPGAGRPRARPDVRRPGLQARRAHPARAAARRRRRRVLRAAAATGWPRTAADR